jgi:hypothetical protein
MWGQFENRPTCPYSVAISERIPQSNKYRRSFIPKADVDPSDNVWPYHGPEAYAGVELKKLRTCVEKVFHDGSQVNERGQFPVGVDIEYCPAEQPDALLKVEQQMAAVNEPVAAVSLRVVSPPYAPFQKGYVTAEV